MNNPLTRRSWSPYLVGTGIGILSWFAFWTAERPIGITTAFENSAAMAGRAIIPAVAEVSPYYADRAKEGQSPKIDWEWMLVVGVFLGALGSAWLSGDRTREKVPPLWVSWFGPSVARRFIAALSGGAMMMFGARLAQGCTSGHGISGALQLALSSWLFVPAFFAVAIVSTLLLYGRKESLHV